MVRKTAVIVTKDDDDEFFTLARSLDYEILQILYFKDHSSKFYISYGKVEDLKRLKPQIVIINGSLKSSQWYNLEKELKIEVQDRIRLIIEIFNDRAHSQEAQLETELATLKFEIPLLKEWIHKSKIGEHPGFMAGGEYEVTQYYDLVKRKIRKIKKSLETVKKQRAEQRKHRTKKGFFLVSLAGYTNSGKSTLMKALSGEEVIIEDRMFSTLTPKISRILNLRTKILITDTVGFIKNLPSWLIEAFNATLEEIYQSDLILLVIDCHEDLKTFKEKVQVSFEILKQNTQAIVVPIMNKIDLNIKNIDEKTLFLKNLITDPILISAKKGINIDSIVKTMEESIEFDREYEFELKKSDEVMSLISFIHEHGKIVKFKENSTIYIKFRINSRFSGRIEKLKYI